MDRCKPSIYTLCTPLSLSLSVCLQHQYSVHLTEEPLDGTHILTNITQVFLAACDCLNIDISCLKLSLQVSGYVSN